MFFGIESYTLNELLAIAEVNDLETDIFDCDDYNFYLGLTNREQNLVYEFSGRTGNDLKLQDIKPC